MKYLFQINLKEGVAVEQYVEAWKKGSELIQKYPGAKGTRLLQKIEEPDTLIAMAEWDSLEARNAAMDALKRTDPQTQEIWKAHAQIAAITYLGAFDETEWIVLPEANS